MTPLDKVKAMFAKSNDRASTEAEAEAAMRRAQSMMEEHGITLDDIREGRDDAFVIHADGMTVSGRWFIAQKYRINALCRFCHVQSWCRFSSYTKFEAKWVGFPSDVETAQWLYDHCRNAILAQSSAFKPNLRRGTSPYIVKLHRDDFAVGMACRISERLNEIQTTRTVNHATTGREITEHKSAMVAEAMDALELEDGKPLRTRTVDATALEAGRQAGDAVGLGRPVDGRSRTAIEFKG